MSEEELGVVASDEMDLREAACLLSLVDGLRR